MSPVSRGRKSKKAKKKGRRLPSVRVVGLGTGRPAWFETTIAAVLDGASVLDAAGGARELEQMTCELLGAQLHQVLQEGHAGLRFSWWFDELVEAARERGATRLLQGLASLGPDSQVTATGQVLRMKDAYGTRFAVLAGFSFGADPFVYLFDIDASESVRLVSAGVFDDVDAAAAAWLVDIGDAAGDVTPQPVKDLSCLSHLAVGYDMVFGDESRVVMDNWFRAQRRIADLGDAVPPAESLFDDLDSMLMAAEFTAWYGDTRGMAPDPDAVFSLAEQWMEGVLPETWYSVSPHRVAVQTELIGEWQPDDPVTIAAKALLSDWTAWLSERAGLPDHLRERVA